METIRVRAVEGHVVPYVDEAGRTVMGRDVGRGPDGTAFEHGEEVPKSAYYLRRVAQGALVLA